MGTAAIRVAALSALLLFVSQVANGMTYGRVTYSDMTVGSDGIIRGWGVTDANSSGCYCHTAKVTTTIRSAKGRTATASDIYGGRGHEYARADVHLLFDEGDLGDYTESSVHWAYCPYCNCYFVNNQSTSDSIRLGVSITWCQFAYHDPPTDQCFYTEMTPCNNACPADVVMYGPPCSNFARVHEPWFSWGGPPDKTKGNFICLVVVNTTFHTNKTDTWNCEDF